MHFKHEKKKKNMSQKLLFLMIYILECCIQNNIKKLKISKSLEQNLEAVTIYILYKKIRKTYLNIFQIIYVVRPTWDDSYEYVFLENEYFSKNMIFEIESQLLCFVKSKSQKLKSANHLLVFLYFLELCSTIKI